MSSAFLLQKEIAHRTPDEGGNVGQKGDVGIAFHPLPLGDRLGRHAEARPEFLLRQLVFAAKGFDLFRNDYLRHFRSPNRRRYPAP